MPLPTGEANREPPIPSAGTAPEDPTAVDYLLLGLVQQYCQAWDYEKRRNIPGQYFSGYIGVNADAIYRLCEVRLLIADPGYEAGPAGRVFGAHDPSLPANASAGSHAASPEAK